MEKVAVNLKLMAQTDQAIETLAKRWGTSKTAVMEHAISIIAKPDFNAAVGDAFGSLEQGLTALESMLRQANDDNAKSFDRAEWNYLADVNNGCNPVMTMSMAHSATMIWANAEDGHRLDHTGNKWFPGKKPTPDAVDAWVAGMVSKLRLLGPLHALAMTISLQWFWAHCHDIDHDKHDWWTTAFRERGM